MENILRRWLTYLTGSVALAVGCELCWGLGAETLLLLCMAFPTNLAVALWLVSKSEHFKRWNSCQFLTSLGWKLDGVTPTTVC